jgi:hypothetical protein
LAEPLTLLEVLDEGDDECALSEEHARHPFDEPELEIFELVLEIIFGGESGGVEFLERFRNALGLRAGEN